MTLTLTGLGNEIDLKSGRAIFTAVFNSKIRIEISKEAAEALTSAIYSTPEEPKRQEAYPEEEEEVRRPSQRATESEGEEFGGDMVTGAPVLRDTPDSVYDEGTGVEQV